MSSSSKTCSIAFTLPISCQICLGKVKQPVVCPNQHVFCQVCMEFWLSRSTQCPACRVQITKDNPCRPVLGGLSEQHQTGQGEDFTTREMRRTRVEVLFKDYENEIERLERKNELLREENKLLNERLSKSSEGSEKPPLYGEGNTGRVKLLIQKLQDAGDLQEKQKREIKALREENKLLKDESGKTGMENQKLKMEVLSRSPRRYGRSTVLAMEGELDKSRKECSALHRALEKSDAYVEDLEKELDKYKKLLPQTAGSNGLQRGEGRGKKQFVNSSGQVDHLQLSRETDSLFDGVKDKRKDRDRVFYRQLVNHRPMLEESLFDSSDTGGQAKSSTDDTFELELPSPVTKGSKASCKLVLDASEEDLPQDTAEGSSLLDNTETTDNETLELPSPVQSAKKRLRFSENVSVGSDRLGVSGVNGHTVVSLQDTRPDPLISSHFTEPTAERVREKVLIQGVRSVTGSGMNTSISGDIEDCMKLLEEAERKVERRRGQGSALEDQGQESVSLGTGMASSSRLLGQMPSQSNGGSNLLGLIANTTHNTLATLGSTHSLTGSVDSGSTFTLSHLTSGYTVQPSLFVSSLPQAKTSQYVSSSKMSGVMLSTNSGNCQSSPVASNSGNFHLNPPASVSGNFLSQPTSAAGFNGSLHGKYSTSNPFVNTLSQESRRF